VPEKHNCQLAERQKPQCQVEQKLWQTREENSVLQRECKSENHKSGDQKVEVQQEQEEESSHESQDRERGQITEGSKEYGSVSKSECTGKKDNVLKEIIKGDDETSPLCHTQVGSPSTLAQSTEERFANKNLHIEAAPCDSKSEQTPSNLPVAAEAAGKEQSLDSGRVADREVARGIADTLQENAGHCDETDSSNNTAGRCDDSDTSYRTARVESSTPPLNHDHDGNTGDVTEPRETSAAAHEHLETNVKAQFSESLEEQVGKSVETKELSLSPAELDCVVESSSHECASVADGDVEVSNELDNSAAERQMSKSCAEGETLGAAAGWYCLPPVADPATLLLACSYCIACVHQIAGFDCLTVLGIVLAVMSLVAALVL
jgi:hypothetical protein